MFATLLSLPTDRYPTIDATPQQLKEQTLTALNDQLLGLASKNPVVFLIEDTHWCDPTTLELIGDAITRIIDARVLLVITYRPEFEAPWAGHAHVSVQTLNRLSRREGSEVVEKVTGGKSLPKEVLDLIVAKTDGIPLYVEELTKNVLEAGFLRDAGDHYELDGPLPALAIPTTLQESLIARLDRLNTVKTIAQIGACIGREFTHELVATVSDLSDTVLQAAFRRLMEAQIILPRGGTSHGSYTFKHALLQDAAYDSLLKEPKRQFHDRIADGLQSKFPDVVANTPELLASHLSKAERFSEAVDYWYDAGIRAVRASANTEAINHLEMGLKHLEVEASSPSRDKRELELYAPYALAMTALHGYGSPKTGTVYERAFALSRNVDNPPELFQILYGLSVNRMVGSRYTEGLSIAKELAIYADAKDDDAGCAMAHRTYGAGLTCVPDFEQAKIHCEKALAAYKKVNSPKFTDEYGHDPKSLALVYLAWTRVHSGFLDQGMALAQEGVAHAETLDFPYGLAHVHFHAGTIFKDLNDPEQTNLHAAALLKIGKKNHFHMMEGMGLVLSGWVDHRRENPNSLSKMEQGFAKLNTTGSDLYATMLRSAHIETLLNQDHYAEAKRGVEKGLSNGEKSGYRWHFPEFIRLKAVCYLGGKNPDLTEVEAMFFESLELAEKHKDRFWQLRCANSLAKLMGERQERQKAYDLLFPIYDWYTEGFDTPDLQEAKELLEQLR